MSEPTKAALRASMAIAEDILRDLTTSLESQGMRITEVTRKDPGPVAEIIDRETALPELIESLERCEILLDAVARYMEQNPIATEYTVHYDEADCDGLCLRDDCKAWAQMVRGALARAGAK